VRETLSEYKFKRIATESLRNGLRLHFDSLLLFHRKSYASALQLSIIAMEEIAKAKWVEHYYDASKSNSGFPDEDFEQEWLKLLYYHPRKQFAFLAREIYWYSPTFVEFVKSKKLENLKQESTYVGLKKKNGKIDVNSRVSIPIKTKELDAKKIITLVNAELVFMCEMNIKHSYYFRFEEMNEIIDKELMDILTAWDFNSEIRSRKWENYWFNRNK